MNASITKSVGQNQNDKIIIDCILRNDDGRLLRSKAQVDTGAEISCISGRVVSTLGLEVRGSGIVYDWEGERSIDYYSVGIAVFKEFAFSNMQVHLFDVPGVDVLIGMDILSKLDFSYSLRDGHPVFSMRYPQSSEPIFLQPLE